MTTLPAVAGEDLADALSALGVRFVSGGRRLDTHLPPVDLVAALAASPEARLRLALIPLFLQHPEFSTAALAASATLDSLPHLTLQCYYTAACLLQQIYCKGIETAIGAKLPLPDLFSKELGLVWTAIPEDNLRRLAERQMALSASQVNWLGTYHHAVSKWLPALARRRV